MRHFIFIVDAFYAFLKAAQQVDSNYQIADWMSFAQAAISSTFVDTPNHNQFAIAIFEEFELNATFYPFINREPLWANYKAAGEKSNKIGSNFVIRLTFLDLSIEKSKMNCDNKKQ